MTTPPDGLIVPAVLIAGRPRVFVTWRDAILGGVDGTLTLYVLTSDKEAASGGSQNQGFVTLFEQSDEPRQKLSAVQQAKRAGTWEASPPKRPPEYRYFDSLDAALASMASPGSGEPATAQGDA